jgi:hypothetical protein
MTGRRLDFRDIKREYPALSSVWISLARWLERHPREVQYLDPRNLARDLRNIPAAEINQALTYLIRDGYYVQVYKLIDPASHTLLAGEYDSPVGIPDRVRDRRDQLIDARDLEIVPLLKANV